MFKRVVLKENNIIEPSEAVEWIETCLPGGITKDLLDKQRENEVNSLDCM